MKILIIEDNPDVRENIEEILDLAGYHTISAENGKIGIKKAKEELPDLIICDIMMPVMDGYDVLYFLSLNPETSCIPFIFLTAKSEKTDFRKGMELGADDYITKPFEESDLIKSIEIRLDKSKRIKNLFVTDSSSQEENSSGETLFKNVKQKKFQAKSYIYLENSQPVYLYKVLKGQVKIFNTNNDGKEFTTSLCSEGDYIGYHALLKDETYTDSAIAVSDTTLELIPRESFFEVMRNNREIANQFIKQLSADVIELEKELLKLAYNSVKKRVADSLVKYFEKYGHEHSSGLSIPREDLANMAGTSTESVIRTLSEFKKDKLIDIQGKHIYINELEELKDYKY